MSGSFKHIPDEHNNW